MEVVKSFYIIPSLITGAKMSILKVHFKLPNVT